MCHPTHGTFPCQRKPSLFLPPETEYPVLDGRPGYVCDIAARSEKMRGAIKIAPL
jgi:hypothetical protein